MAKTLYDALMNARIIARRRSALDGETHFYDFYDKFSENSREGLRKIEKVELRAKKKRIVEKYCEHSKFIWDVINGNSSFYDYAKPILNNLDSLEDKFSDKSLGYIGRRGILGKDPREMRDVAECSDFLIRERIIDPKNFFHSTLILPDPIKKYSDALYQVNKRQRGIFYPEITLFCGTTMAASIGYFNYSGIGAFLGGIVGAISTCILQGIAFSAPSSESLSISKVSKDKKYFIQAIEFMDSEIRHIFHPEQQTFNFQ